MMSVSQEVIKGVTKNYTSFILLVGSQISGSIFTRFTCFDIGTSLHYNVLLGVIIISFSRSKRVNGKIISLCTRSEENPCACKSSTATVFELRFFMKKIKKMKKKKMKKNL